MQKNNSYNCREGAMMSDQETYGRFTPSAWNYIKSIRLTEEEQDIFRLMIETKTETITLDKVKHLNQVQQPEITGRKKE